MEINIRIRLIDNGLIFHVSGDKMKGRDFFDEKEFYSNTFEKGIEEVVGILDAHKKKLKD